MPLIFLIGVPRAAELRSKPASKGIHIRLTIIMIDQYSMLKCLPGANYHGAFSSVGWGMLRTFLLNVSAACCRHDLLSVKFFDSASATCVYLFLAELLAPPDASRSMIFLAQAFAWQRTRHSSQIQ